MRLEDSMAREIYIRPPTSFILDNLAGLLPDRPVVPESIVLVLLHSRFPLDGSGDRRGAVRSERVEREKENLLNRYCQFAGAFREASARDGYWMEAISPKDGFPLYSTRGEKRFDLVAIVHETLGWNFGGTAGGCKVLEHPRWKTAVYPGLFLSAAENSVVDSLLATSNKPRVRPTIIY